MPSTRTHFSFATLTTNAPVTAGVMFQNTMYANKQVFKTFFVLCLFVGALIGVRYGTSIAIDATERTINERTGELAMVEALQECLTASAPKINEEFGALSRSEAWAEAEVKLYSIVLVGLLVVAALIYVTSVAIAMIYAGEKHNK